MSRFNWDRGIPPLLTTAAQMREIDRLTIEELGLAGVALMESAGRAAAEGLARLLPLPWPDDLPVLVLCGPGNNGGDGFVVARYALQWGLRPWVLLLAPLERVTGDALTHLQLAERTGVQIRTATTAELVATELDLAFGANPCAVVDALLGTGLADPVRGLFAAAIDRINREVSARRLPCLGVDIPSGVCADTGRILGNAVACTATVTFGLPKWGLALAPGAALAGKVQVANIGLWPEAVRQTAAQPATWVQTVRHTAATLLSRATPTDAHKGTYGHVIAFAGSPGKAGAALLAGHAAITAGAGLVTLATCEATAARLEGRVPELMVEIACSSAHATADPDHIEALCAGKSCVLAGPGLGRTESTLALVETLLAISPSNRPLVLDADALAVFAGRLAALAARSPCSLVLTPHPGEAAMLLGVTTADVQGNRPRAARELAARCQGWVVLKGAGTLVAAPDGEVRYISEHAIDLATAGSGDVLAGIIAAWFARPPADLATLAAAVHLHALAGSSDAPLGLKTRGLTASSLIQALPAALRSLAEFADGTPLRAQ